MVILGMAITGAALFVMGYLAWALDDWQGMLAYMPQYLTVSLVVAGLVGAAWLARSRVAALTAGAATLAVLLWPYSGEQPSSRILRRLLLDVEVGTPAEQVPELIAAAYESSRFITPSVEESPARVSVFLGNQRRGDATSATFYVEDGVVVGSSFSAD